MKKQAYFIYGDEQCGKSIFAHLAHTEFRIFDEYEDTWERQMHFVEEALSNGDNIVIVASNISKCKTILEMLDGARDKYNVTMCMFKKFEGVEK